MLLLVQEKSKRSKIEKSTKGYATHWPWSMPGALTGGAENPKDQIWRTKAPRATQCISYGVHSVLLLVQEKIQKAKNREEHQGLCNTLAMVYAWGF